MKTRAYKNRLALFHLRGLKKGQKRARYNRALYFDYRDYRMGSFGLEDPHYLRGPGPELLQAEEFPFLGRKYVDDNVATVHQYPS